MAAIVKDRKCSHGNARCRCNWLLRWRDADGKSREKSFPWDKKTVANDWAKKVEGDAIQGVRTVTSNAKFGAFAEKVIRQRTGADTTKTRYLGILKNHLGMLAQRKLSAVATDRAGVKTLLLETLPQKGLGRAQIELCQVVITSTMAEAIRENEIPSHNLGGIRLPVHDDESVDPEMIEMATMEKIGEMAAAMPQEWALSVWLARGCGLRLGEALGVRISDFSPDMTTLTIARQVRSGTATGPLKSRKPGETRSVPVPASVAQKVTEHVEEHGTRDGYLFTGSRSLFVPDSSFGVAWRKARVAAEMPAFRFHDLRHCYASRLIANGVDSFDVGKCLGHKDPGVTYRIYHHFLRKSADHIRSLIDAEWNAK